MQLPIEAKDHPCMSGGACQCGGSCGGGCGSKPAPSPLGSLDAYVVMDDIAPAIRPAASEGDGESYMSVQALQSMRDHAEDLLSRVDHGTRLPDWVEAKLTRAAQSLNDVYEYMSHGKGQRIAGVQNELLVFNQQHPYHADLDLIDSRNRTLIGNGTFDIDARRAGLLARAGMVNIIEGMFGKELELTNKGRRSLRESSDAFAAL